MFLLIEALEDNDIAYGFGIFLCWAYILHTPAGQALAPYLAMLH